MLHEPFSVYLKPWQQPWIFSADVLAGLQPIFAIPLQGLDWQEGISTMRDPQLTAKPAAHVSTRIPDATYGTGKLLTDYWNSKLAPPDICASGDEPDIVFRHGESPIGEADPPCPPAVKTLEAPARHQEQAPF